MFFIFRDVTELLIIVWWSWYGIHLDSHVDFYVRRFWFFSATTEICFRQKSFDYVAAHSLFLFPDSRDSHNGKTTFFRHLKNVRSLLWIHAGWPDKAVLYLLHRGKQPDPLRRRDKAVTTCRKWHFINEVEARKQVSGLRCFELLTMRCSPADYCAPPSSPKFLLLLTTQPFLPF